MNCNGAFWKKPAIRYGSSFKRTINNKNTKLIIFANHSQLKKQHSHPEKQNNRSLKRRVPSSSSLQEVNSLLEYHLMASSRGL